MYTVAEPEPTAGFPHSTHVVVRVWVAIEDHEMSPSGQPFGEQEAVHLVAYAERQYGQGFGVAKQTGDSPPGWALQAGHGGASVVHTASD